jgi:hypothetical protein
MGGERGLGAVMGDELWPRSGGNHGSVVGAEAGGWEVKCDSAGGGFLFETRAELLIGSDAS